MSDSALTVALTVAGTLLGAVVGVFGSLLVARHAAKDNLVVEERRLQGELTKIKQQESDQQAVLERENRRAAPAVSRAAELLRGAAER